MQTVSVAKGKKNATAPAHAGTTPAAAPAALPAAAGLPRYLRSGLLEAKRRGDSPVQGQATARNAAPPIVHNVLRSPGRPLDVGMRALMESRFGHDFGGVRIHTDAQAAASARAVNALAYTVGHKVVFGAGQYAPHTTAGKRLIGHELTHVVQQGGSAPATAVGLAPPGTTLERQADAAAHAAVAGQYVAPLNLTSPVQLSRSWAGDIGRVALGIGGGSVVSATLSDEVAETVGGGLMGECKEDPTFAMIGVDLGVSLIPFLDQASDARDLICHAYYMIFDEQYDDPWRWVGLAFTLIGLIPEAGSAIKAASKFVIKAVREALSHVDDLLPFIRRFFGHADFRQLHRFVSSRWDEWKAIGRAMLDHEIDRFAKLLGGFSAWLSSSVLDIALGLGKVRRMAPHLLDGAFNWIRRQWDELAERLFSSELEHAGQLAVAGAAGGIKVPDNILLSEAGRSGKLPTRTTMTTVEDLKPSAGPRSTGEAIDELEETMRGSRTSDPREAGYMATAGTQIQRPSVEDWARRLGSAWQVLTRDTWPSWLRRRLPRGGPDMVAINTSQRRIIVGDVAPSAASRVDVRPGRGRGAPASTRRAGERDVVRAGDEGTMMHVEKTIDDARRVAAGLPNAMSNFKVFAQEYYWQAGQRFSRLIQVYP